MIHDTSLFSPDFLTREASLLCAKKGHDPDTPSLMEAMTGQHRDEFLDSMQTEINELGHHCTWEVVQRANFPLVKQPDGTMKTPQVLLGTWAFRLKQFPSGILRRIKARFCA